MNPFSSSDKSSAMLLGLASGDALGTTLEFSKRDSQPKITQVTSKNLLS